MTPEERANQIIDTIFGRGAISERMNALRDAITAALDAARRVPPGHVRDEQGVDHKFPVSADGVPLMVGDEVWYPGEDSAMYVGGMVGGRPIVVNCWLAGNTKEMADSHLCYYTREAAEAARKGNR